MILYMLCLMEKSYPQRTFIVSEGIDSEQKIYLTQKRTLEHYDAIF